VTRLLVVGVVISVALIVAILGLIRTRRLQERYAILWLVAGLGVVVFGVWGDALDGLAGLLGIAYGPSALFLLAAAFAIGVLLHTAVVLTRLSNQNQTLAQRLALAEERLRRLEAKTRDGEDPSHEEVLPRAPRIVPARQRRLARTSDGG
jgi:hypothetical protein